MTPLHFPSLVHSRMVALSDCRPVAPKTHLLRFFIFLESLSVVSACFVYPANHPVIDRSHLRQLLLIDGHVGFHSRPNSLDIYWPSIIQTRPRAFRISTQPFQLRLQPSFPDLCWQHDSRSSSSPLLPSWG